jgi:TRAP-type C4-dicarboxylate transport system permease small subunit
MPIIYALAVVDSTNVPNGSGPNLQTILNIVLGIVGALAFLLIVIAGLRYTLSQGDPAKIAEAKHRIMYAAVGLVIVGMAATIVNFALGNIGQK